MRLSLLEARRAKNMTQKELGELIGLSKASISDLERCRVQGKVGTWDKLEALLKVPAKRLREITAQGENND